MVDNLPASLENVDPFAPLVDINHIFEHGELQYEGLGEYLPAPDLSHLDKPPTLDEIESSHKFEVALPGESSGKSSWVVSFFWCVTVRRRFKNDQLSFSTRLL